MVLKSQVGSSQGLSAVYLALRGHQGTLQVPSSGYCPFRLLMKSKVKSLTNAIPQVTLSEMA